SVLLLLAVVAIGSTIATVRVTRAEQQANEKLWASYLAQARAGRLSGAAGRRTDSLGAIAAATRTKPSMELRNEAIACLALSDLAIGRKWNGYPEGSTAIAFDRSLRRYARADSQGAISVLDATNDRELAKLQGSGACAIALGFGPNDRHLFAWYLSSTRTGV